MSHCHTVILLVNLFVQKMYFSLSLHHSNERVSLFVVTIWPGSSHFYKDQNIVTIITTKMRTLVKVHQCIKMIIPLLRNLNKKGIWFIKWLERKEFILNTWIPEWKSKQNEWEKEENQWMKTRNGIRKIFRKKTMSKKKSFGLVSWHINHHRLFNAKSIFIHINSSISNNSV